MNTITLVLVIFAILAIVIFYTLLLNPLKIKLCELKICGVVVPANRVIPVFQGGSVKHWALPFGLKMVKGKLQVNKDTGNGNNLPPGNPGDDLGIWWIGWFAWFLGYRFPKISADKKTGNKYALLIEKVRKDPKAKPNTAIADSFERVREYIEDLRVIIDRFIIVSAVELSDGSVVNTALKSINGFVEDPEKFWVNHGTDAFTIWESSSATVLSDLLSRHSFESAFRLRVGSSEPSIYKSVPDEFKKNPPELADIGISKDSATTKLEQWEDASSQDIREQRDLYPKKIAEQAALQAEEIEKTRTAGFRAERVKAETEVAKSEFTRVLELAGKDSDAQKAAHLVLLAKDAGAIGAEIIRGVLAVEARKATPGLVTLVEGNSSGATIQVSATTPEKKEEKKS